MILNFYLNSEVLAVIRKVHSESQLQREVLDVCKIKWKKKMSICFYINPFTTERLQERKTINDHIRTAETPMTNNKRYPITFLNEKWYRWVSICQDQYSCLWISLSSQRQGKAEAESKCFFFFPSLNANTAICPCSSQPSQLLVFSLRAALSCEARQSMDWNPHLCI